MAEHAAAGPSGWRRRNGGIGLDPPRKRRRGSGAAEISVVIPEFPVLKQPAVRPSSMEPGYRAQPGAFQVAAPREFPADETGPVEAADVVRHRKVGAAHGKPSSARRVFQPGVRMGTDPAGKLKPSRQGPRSQPPLPSQTQQSRLPSGRPTTRHVTANCGPAAQGKDRCESAQPASTGSAQKHQATTCFSPGRAGAGARGLHNRPTRPSTARNHVRPAPEEKRPHFADEAALATIRVRGSDSARANRQHAGQQSGVSRAGRQRGGRQQPGNAHHAPLGPRGARRSSATNHRSRSGPGQPVGPIKPDESRIQVEDWDGQPPFAGDHRPDQGLKRSPIRRSRTSKPAAGGSITTSAAVTGTGNSSKGTEMNVAEGRVRRGGAHPRGAADSKSLQAAPAGRKEPAPARSRRRRAVRPDRPNPSTNAALHQAPPARTAAR